MVLYDQIVFTFVYCDCLASDQELNVWKKHDVVRFHLECTYMKIKVKKVGCFGSLVASLLCWFHWLRPLGAVLRML